MVSRRTKRRYVYETTVCIDGQNDIDVKASFTVTWGRPATGPTYACGGTPADPDEVGDVTVETVDGKPRPWGPHPLSDMSDDILADAIGTVLSEAHYDRMLEEASEKHGEELAAYYERKWEEARGEFV